MMERDDNLLDDHFAALRGRVPDATPDFMARVLADALALQPKAVAPVVMPAPVRPGFWAGLSGAFGGSGVLAGLGGVAALGLAVGYADPSVLSGGWLASAEDGLELSPAAEIFLIEG